MSRHVKHLHPNQNNTINSNLNLVSSYYAVKAQLEIQQDIIRCKTRKNRRLERVYKLIDNPMMLLQRSMNTLENRQRRSWADSGASVNTMTTGFTVNYLKPDIELETRQNVSILKSDYGIVNGNIPNELTMPIPLLVKIGNITRQTYTSDYLKHYQYKDEVSEGQLLSFKIKTHDYEEIITHIELCYTFQLIERSACLNDRDWSGSYLPSVNDNAEFLYSGGYGLVDGVTECNKMNLAAKKYQNIELNNDEAVEALSHMYSMQHLLDGVNEGIKDLKGMPKKDTSSVPPSDDSQSSRFSLLGL